MIAGLRDLVCVVVIVSISAYVFLLVARCV